MGCPGPLPRMPEKKRRDRLSQRARPHQQRWPAPETTEKLPARPLPTDAPAPTALACYGRRGRPGPRPADQRWQRFGAGRPVRALTRAWLAWGAAQRAAPGCTALLLLWHHASWHRSHAGRPGRRQPTHQGKQGAAGGRIVVCPWPRKSPWRNPIAPTWGQGKRAVSAPDRLRRAAERAVRVYADYACEHAEPLGMPKKVA